MPFHIKKAGIPANAGIGDVYFKGSSTWTETYADRKQYSTKSPATTKKNATVTFNGVSYVPKAFADSTIVTE